MDVRLKLDEITRLVEDARAMPMSASCLVNREELLGHLEELRSLLPEQLQQADVVLSDRDAVVDAGRDTAKRLVDQARAEHDRLVEEQAVVIGSRERAATIVAEANAESTRLLSDADDYVDRKLAEFEIALDKLGQQVARGRARLGARRAADYGRLGAESGDDEKDEAAGPAGAGEVADRAGPDEVGDEVAGEPAPTSGEHANDDLKGFGLGDSAPLR